MLADVAAACITSATGGSKYSSLITRLREEVAASEVSLPVQDAKQDCARWEDFAACWL